METNDSSETSVNLYRNPWRDILIVSNLYVISSSINILINGTFTNKKRHLDCISLLHARLYTISYDNPLFMQKDAGRFSFQRYAYHTIE